MRQPTNGDQWSSRRRVRRPARRPRTTASRPAPAALLVPVACLIALLAPAAPAGAVGDGGARTADPEQVSWSRPEPGTYRPPVSRRVRDPFRMEHGPYGAGNRGLEYATESGDVVGAIGAGRVSFAGPVAGRLAVTVLHPDGRRSSVTGLVRVDVAVGELVVRGRTLGVAGVSLHLGVREGDRYIDPATLFTAARRRAVLVPLGAEVPD